MLVGWGKGDQLANAGNALSLLLDIIMRSSDDLGLAYLYNPEWTACKAI